MKAEEFIAAIKTQRPDRKYLYWDDEHRMMLEITRAICDRCAYELSKFMDIDLYMLKERIE